MLPAHLHLPLPLALWTSRLWTRLPLVRFLRQHDDQISSSPPSSPGGCRSPGLLWPIPEAPPWCWHRGMSHEAVLYHIIVTFVVSTFGSFGAQAQALIKDIGRRTNLFVPPSLSHETFWATSSINTFLRSRSALTFQVRKRVAVILREHLPDDFLPPPIQTPLTESDQGNLVGNFLA